MNELFLKSIPREDADRIRSIHEIVLTHCPEANFRYEASFRGHKHVRDEGGLSIIDYASFAVTWNADRCRKHAIYVRRSPEVPALFIGHDERVLIFEPAIIEKAIASQFGAAK